MNFSSFYNIGNQQPNLEFVDVRLNRDNMLFLDPRLIELHNDPFSKRMQERIAVFWGEFIKAVKAKNRKKTYEILGGLKEPAETRLGYANDNSRGNAVARKLKPKMIKAIEQNKAVMSGVLKHFCDIELFIEDVSSDRISDITTKIIKDVLIEFTQEQCKLYNIPMKSVWQEDIFDHNKVEWVKRKVLLPIYFGKPVILVPKNIVRLEGVAGQNFKCFYRFAVRNFIQYDHSMLEDVSGTGRGGKILLRDVQLEHPISKESLSNWVLKYGKLLVDYKSDILTDRLRVLSDREIMNIVYSEDLFQAG
ncbi:hypothetical protein [Salinimicrobium gaetbulicola]|uniref:DUF4238 domain-containing protein n=1 Tax=Salinimicrobium gaetbulicola TaxID=999702 RepID=A0ABW3IJ04_9FLAO